MIRVTEAVKLDDREVEERFVRAIGSRGQNARHEANAVELRLDIDASSLPKDIKDRLKALGGRAVTTKGVLVVSSRARRSQADNRLAARKRLTAFLQRAALRPKTRRPTRPRRPVREERLAAKHRRSELKTARRSAEDI